MLSSLFVFTIILDLYVVQTLRVLVEANPKIIRTVGKYREGGIADRLMTIAIFFASVSISFMLLLKGQELIIEAFVWFLLCIIRIIFSHLIVHGYIRLPLRRPQTSLDAQELETS